MAIPHLPTAHHARKRGFHLVLSYAHTKPKPLCTQSKGLRTRRANGVKSRPRQENINVPSQAGKVPLCSCMSTQSLQLGLTLRNPMNCSPPGSSVHGILQARTLEWVGMPSSRGSFLPRDGTHVFMSPSFAGGFFTSSATSEAQVYV